MKRALKNHLKVLSRLFFEKAQRLGVDVLPHHFYSQIPDIAELRKDPYWQAPSSMYGVSGCEVQQQVAFVQGCCPNELSQHMRGMDIHQSAIRENGEDGGYGPIEAEFLYCFIRSKKPARIVQIGCGVSTSIILRAARDAGYQPEVVCVEPFPMPFLVQLAKDGRIQLVKEKAQKVPLETLTALANNDFFFVDSTHTVKTGSEVNRIILEVLPRLAPQVWVHFHDIYFPYDYKRDVLEGDLFFWSESTILHAFLIHNRHCHIRASLSMLHYAAPAVLKNLFQDYEPQGNKNGLRNGEGKHFPSAIYLQTV